MTDYDPDDALRRAKRALGKTDDSLRPGWLTRAFTATGDFGKKAWETALWVNDHTIMPVARFLKPAWNGYKNLFHRVSHPLNKETGERKFSPFRAAGMTAASLAMAFGLATQAVPWTADLVYDGVFMAATTRTEQMFMNGSHPLNDAGTRFYARGCDQLPCTAQDNSDYFMLRDNTWLDLKYLVTKGRPYMPELVQSSIPDGFSACKVTHYGIRFRPFGWYRNVVDAACRPLTVQETNMLEGGHTIHPNLVTSGAVIPASPAAPSASPAG